MSERPEFSTVKRLACLALALSATLPAAAQDHSRVAILPGWQMADGRYLAGVEITLGPGWKTYWRQPGEGGIPPIFDWSASDNVASVEAVWPTPDIFDTYGMRTLGYSDRVVFPMMLTPVDATEPVRATLAMSYGVCSDICIPAQAEAANTLTRGEPVNVSVLSAALDARAIGPESAGVTGTSCNVAPQGEYAYSIEASIGFSEAAPGNLVAVFEVPEPDLWIGTPQAAPRGDTLTAQARMDWFGDGPLALVRDDIRITLIEPGVRSIEISGC
ncbi:protein-disulfide reductase DsbD domain-containing protein [Pontivivens ytuae]|uniref:Thiol:disulfide interchange protein DsbD N-terminal domain-containing protein n=1 Tax=Pontivivens ytuae TaxID=2789856 RepID=A0A7S9LNE2_9RHOB|nr:protein-disulfide reductase DsbD domain-containing protein [Pontivivens ytuae]QPH52307.1 hypothetical protein I0K15_10755 [Pontivivens ytuae]